MTTVTDLAGVRHELEADYGAQAQRAAEAHLMAVWQAFEDDTAPHPEVGPFCGCPTCEVRETLAAAWPFLEAGVRKAYHSETNSLGGT